VTQPLTDILDAMGDPNLFRPWFKDMKTWVAWRAFLAALFGLPMSASELVIFQQCTGRDAPPTSRVSEAWLVVGRRGGKSMILALIGAFLAAFIDWTPYLVPGETAVIPIIAADRRQARAIYRYLRAMFQKVPLLAALLEKDPSDDEVVLKSGITIEITTASFRTIRGVTVIAALLDEIAFWRTGDAANPDFEILAALRPAMATIPQPMLLAASSPYAKRGELWDAYRRFFGKPDPILVWKAPTLTMNPAVPRRVIDDAYERDDVSAAAEYGAEFRSDLESYVSREVIEAAVIPDRHELPRVATVVYSAFADPSGGSNDSFTLAIGHRQDGAAVLDAVREHRPPFSPDGVVQEFAGLLLSYGISSVRGDRYAGQWPVERFSTYGISYEPAELTKSDLYRDFLPLLMGRRVELLDNPRLVAQFAGLERRVSRAGKDSIDHQPGGHDDVSNAVAGVCTSLIASNSLDTWARLGMQD
jgi:hypothetical protein